MKHKNKILIVFESIFIVGVLFLFFNRLVRGVDTTDESFYATMAYRLVQGNLIFRDMWEQASTSAIIPSLFLAIYKGVTGNVDGVILFFRLAFFACNLFASFFLFRVINKIFNEYISVLVCTFYLVYAPFHLYTFSYNNMANLFVTVAICSLMSAYIERKKKYFFFMGVTCALLTLTYPTMILMCLFLFVMLLIMKRKMAKHGIMFYILGGMSIATIVTVIIVGCIGIEGLLLGIRGILSDPAYGGDSTIILDRVKYAFSYLAEPFLSESVTPFQLWGIWMVVLFFIRNKWPVLKNTFLLFPIIAFFAYDDMKTFGTYSYGNYIFIIATIAPILILYLQDNRYRYIQLLWFGWLPSFFSYLIFSVSSAGMAKQAVHSLVFAAVVGLAGIVLIVDEYRKSLKKHSEKDNFFTFIILLFLASAILSELTIYNSVVYRDDSIEKLKHSIESGVYKGLYTTEEKKNYLETMDMIMEGVEEKGETAMVLWHSNFAYLMLDMLPVTPTTWGIYPQIDNQKVFIDYFRNGSDFVPEYVYIVDVPEQFNLDFQHSQYYTHCTQLSTILEQNYQMEKEVVVQDTGRVKKYKLDDKRFKLSFVEQLRGVYATEYTEDGYFNWLKKRAVIEIWSDGQSTLELTASAQTLNQEDKTLTIKCNEKVQKYSIGTTPIDVAYEVQLKKGINKVIIQSNTENPMLENDARDLHIMLNNLVIKYDGINMSY